MPGFAATAIWLREEAMVNTIPDDDVIPTGAGFCLRSCAALAFAKAGHAVLPCDAA